MNLKIDKAVFRVFEARTKPGKLEMLRQKLSSTSVAVVNGEPGNLGYFFGEPLSSENDSLVFVSVWESLDAIKRRFGADWQESFLPEGYGDLIEICSIRHFRFDGEIRS